MSLNHAGENNNNLSYSIKISVITIDISLKYLVEIKNFKYCIFIKSLFYSGQHFV